MTAVPLPVDAAHLISDTGQPRGPYWRLILALLFLAVFASVANTHGPELMRSIRSAPAQRSGPISSRLVGRDGQ